jgi:hypothetical protein
MHRITYIVFLFIFIIQQSLANSINHSENSTEEKSTIEITQKKQNITSPNMLRTQAFLNEIKTRYKLVLPLFIAGIIELYLSSDLDTSISRRLERCGQAVDRNSFIDCRISYEKLVRHQRTGTNFILHHLLVYFLIDTVLSSSFIVSKNLYKYVANPISFFTDLFFNGFLYLYLFEYYSFIFDSDLLSSFMMAYTIIICLTNLWDRTKENSETDKKLKQLQNDINNSLN